MTKKPPTGPDASPQRRFHAKESNIKNHQELVDSYAFEFGCDVALLQYVQERVERITDMNSAAAGGFEIKGAVEAIHKLKTLAELPKPSTVTASPSALRPTEPPRRV